MQPTIDLIPLRSALCPQMASTLDLLIRITPPSPEKPEERPDLNLSLVLDRSGSMQGHNKMPYAKAAVQYAIEQLQGRDRVSIVAFDDRVEIPVPSTLAQQKHRIAQALHKIQARGSTALHAGWLAGGTQVSQHLKTGQLNRVIVLSDGLANVGETNPDVISQDVRGLAQRGVSTSTVGVGDDYDEQMLEAIAASGDGSYYYIESPDQLPNIFEQELQGLMATLGRKVTLALELAPGVICQDCFNDFNTGSNGDYQLPNLIAGNPFSAAFRIQVPVQKQTPLDWVLKVHLGWDDVDSGDRKTAIAPLTLPWVSQSELEDLPFNNEVQQEVALLTVARAKKEAAEQAKQGQYDLAQATIVAAQYEFSLAAPAAAMPASAMAPELASFDSLLDDLQSQRYETFSKRGHYESHLRGRGWSQSQYQDYQSQRKSKGSSANSQNPGGQNPGGQNIHSQNPHSQNIQGQTLRSQPDLVQQEQILQEQVQQGKIQVIQGDISKIAADAIVNATNAKLDGSTGVDAAIHAAAGLGLKAECRQIGHCDPGQAVLTNAYRLPAQWVIHTVGPRWNGGQQHEAAVLQSCYESCIDLADQNGAKTLTFPAIATGALGCPLAWAVEIAVRSVSRALQTSSLEQITFVCFDLVTLKAYQDCLETPSLV